METFHLEDRPDFAPTVADRYWHAWWRNSNVTLARYQDAFETMTVKTRLPSALVACQGGTFAGSVLLIDDDLPDRPRLTPWIAALWVEPDLRRRGVGLTLIAAARHHAVRLGYEICYLNATEEKSSYYEARGFRRIASGVGDVNVFSIAAGD